MTEEWRAVPGWPAYRVSNHGRVIGPKGAVLRPDTIKGGYRRVTLCAAPRVWRPMVHHLVLNTFCGPAPASAPIARHMDGDSRNNDLSNLQWGTRSDNEGDKVRHGTSNRGAGNGRAKLTVENVRAIRKRLAEGEPQTQIARELSISAVTINHISTGRTWGNVA